MIAKVSAETLAKEQRQVSVSEFFERNRHLLGYDNATKALLTVIKEAVDNSLDACEEANILPDISIEIKQISEDRFKIIVEDNGPGIIKENIPKVFGSLLFGSKFHRLRQSRGIQGIGISAAVLYAQLTTGKSAKIISKISSKKKAHFYEIHIDTKNNEAEVIKDEEVESKKDHGTEIEIEIEANYQRGAKSVDEYLRQTAVVNPHLSLKYKNPKGETFSYPRAAKELPILAKEIKPHPYGVELGILIRMLKDTNARTLSSFLQKEFSRVSSKVAKEICEKANLNVNSRPGRIAKQEADNLMKAIKNTKIMAPPTNCLSPIGEDLMIKGLKKEINADFYEAITRPPSVYRGNPFQIEVGIAYGGDLKGDELAKIMRFANKVPLLYQKGSCATYKASVGTAWRNYGLSQSRGSLPSGPILILIHIASVWVPFTSESKEAIAHYPEIIKEMKLALQEAGRKLGSYVRKKVKAKEQREKMDLFEKYIPELASSLHNLTGEKKKDILNNLNKTLKKGIVEININGK